MAQAQIPGRRGSRRRDGVPGDLIAAVRGRRSRPRIFRSFRRGQRHSIAFLIGGKGSPVVLLHGYAETGRMWLPIMPLLAERHTVIIPDLRGAGGSAKPES